jgi:hypothetical protein
MEVTPFVYGIMRVCRANSLKEKNKDVYVPFFVHEKRNYLVLVE